MSTAELSKMIDQLTEEEMIADMAEFRRSRLA